MAHIGYIINLKTGVKEKIELPSELKCVLIHGESKACMGIRDKQMKFYAGYNNHAEQNVDFEFDFDNDKSILYAYNILNCHLYKEPNNLTINTSYPEDSISPYFSFNYLYRSASDENNIKLFTKNFFRFGPALGDASFFTFLIDKYEERFQVNDFSNFVLINSYGGLSNSGKFLRLKNNKHGITYFNGSKICFVHTDSLIKSSENINQGQTTVDPAYIKKIDLTQYLYHILTIDDTPTNIQTTYYDIGYPYYPYEYNIKKIPIIIKIVMPTYESSHYTRNIVHKLLFLNFEDMRVESSVDIYLLKDTPPSSSGSVADEDDYKIINYFLSDLNKKEVYLDILFARSHDPYAPVQYYGEESKTIIKHRYNISNMMNTYNNDHSLDSDILIMGDTLDEYSNATVYMRSYKPSYHGKNKPRFFTKTVDVNKTKFIINSPASNEVIENIPTFVNKKGIYNTKYADEKYILENCINKDTHIISKVLSDHRFTSFDFMTPNFLFIKDDKIDHLKLKEFGAYINKMNSTESIARNIYYDFLSDSYNQIFYDIYEEENRFNHKIKLDTHNTITTHLTDYRLLQFLLNDRTRLNNFRYYQTIMDRVPINEYYKFIIFVSSQFYGRDIGSLVSQTDDILFISKQFLDMYDSYKEQFRDLIDDNEPIIKKTLFENKFKRNFLNVNTMYMPQFSEDYNKLYELGNIMIPFASGFIPSIGVENKLFAEDTLYNLAKEIRSI